MTNEWRAVLAALANPDVAALRRYLVDEGLMLRTRSGTSYSRS